MCFFPLASSPVLTFSTSSTSRHYIVHRRNAWHIVCDRDLFLEGKPVPWCTHCMSEGGDRKLDKPKDCSVWK